MASGPQLAIGLDNLLVRYQPWQERLIGHLKENGKDAYQGRHEVQLLDAQQSEHGH